MENHWGSNWPRKPAAPSAIAPQLDNILETVRQTYLDALPIAAAIVTVNGRDSYIECANDHFRLVAEWDERLGDRSDRSRCRSSSPGPIAIRLAAFLRGTEAAHQFDTPDGRSVAGRHFTVRFARLRVLEGQPVRLLLSLIDKTAQVETEKSLRSEMLRDSLTGLPNRFAFNEQVDAVLADPNFGDGQLCRARRRHDPLQPGQRMRWARWPATNC